MRSITHGEKPATVTSAMSMSLIPPAEAAVNHAADQIKPKQLAPEDVLAAQSESVGKIARR
jgi:hypothetical protein